MQPSCCIWNADILTIISSEVMATSPVESMWSLPHGGHPCGSQCVYNAEPAPCEHVECRLGMVEAPRCWAKNSANSFVECYDSVGLGFVSGWFKVYLGLAVEFFKLGFNSGCF